MHGGAAITVSGLSRSMSFIAHFISPALVKKKKHPNARFRSVAAQVEDTETPDIEPIKCACSFGESPSPMKFPQCIIRCGGDGRADVSGGIEWPDAVVNKERCYGGKVLGTDTIDDNGVGSWII